MNTNTCFSLPAFSVSVSSELNCKPKRTNFEHQRIVRRYDRCTNASSNWYAHQHYHDAHLHSKITQSISHSCTQLHSHTPILTCPPTHSLTHSYTTLIVIVVSFNVCKTIKRKSYFLGLEKLIILMCQSHFLTPGE